MKIVSKINFVKLIHSISGVFFTMRIVSIYQRHISYLSAESLDIKAFIELSHSVTSPK